MGVGLVRSLQPWDILLINCNNQFKKVYNSLANTSKGGTTRPPSDVYARSFLSPFSYFNKTLHTKALEWSNLVPGPEAKSSSEIKSPTSFTVSYPKLY